jgi:hypothetical protein
MTDSISKRTDAIDLMIQDLLTRHFDIRNSAKKLGCEKELDQLKEQLLTYLHEIR